MLDFSTLKANSGKKTLDQLTSKLASVSGGESKSGDENFWKPTVDKAGNGYAVIRFLPAPEGEDMPFVRMWNHGFKGVGGWYIENSLTTIGQDDPVSEHNSELWNSGIEANKDTVRKQKRRLAYISNILVVKDPSNPQNEGQVFLYKYGKKIFDKLNDVMNPQFPDEKPVNPFDFWEGADFNLKIRQVEGYRNYDKSEFSSPSAITGDDEALEVMWKKQHSLQEIVDPKNFKSYSELKAKLYKVLGLDGGSHAPTKTAEDDEPAMDFTPKFRETSSPTLSEAPSPNTATAVGDDDDDTLDFFKSLADD